MEAVANVITLRTGAETLAAPLPALLADAEHLAATVIVGDHGRRRAGLGDTFWQYRPATDTDSPRRIDWRRSARSDTTFVQDKEWQIAQSVTLWVDGSAAMTYASDGHETKGDRARTLALAMAILLNRGGERIGLTGHHGADGATGLPPRGGTPQIARLGEAMLAPHEADYGHPDPRDMAPNTRALFASDFLGDLERTEAAVTRAADRGVRGALVQVLDPSEETFPFDGRTIFQSMTGALQHETLKAGNLRDRYVERLAARKDRLATLARTTGWQYTTHHSDTSASAALMWCYHALARR